MQDAEIQEFFARLTAQFEDCAALAAEGQQAGMSPARFAGLSRRIRDILKGAERCVALVEEYLDGQHQNSGEMLCTEFSIELGAALASALKNYSLNRLFMRVAAHRIAECCRSQKLDDL